MVAELREFAELQQDAARAALEAAGLAGASIELHTALAALLRNPNLIERWGRGGSLVKKQA